MIKRTMKAIVMNAYGSSDVLEEANVDIPEFGKKQLLVEVHAAGVNPLDWKIRSGKIKFITGKKFPRILGSDISGIVKEVGEDVTEFKPDDEIFAMKNTIFQSGGYAEYTAVYEKYTCKKPKNLSTVDAGAIPSSALTALRMLRSRVKLREGQHILINGASGGVGTFAVQIARILGADVTGVCSGKNVELVSSLGADKVIDYIKKDFVNESEKYDVIFDTVGNKKFADCKRVLNKKGIYITIVPNVKKILTGIITSVLPGIKCKFASVVPNLQDLLWLKKRVEENKIKPVIDKIYPLNKAKEAHDYIEKGHVRGKIVLKIKEENAGS